MLKEKCAIEKLDHSFDISINLPGSKSITLRNFLLASIADGVSKVRYPGICDDTYRMEEALRNLGVNIKKEDQNTLTIQGNNGKFSTEELNINVGESGASTRLLMALCLLRRGKTIIDGHESMRARPNKYLLDALKELGASVKSTNDGYLPVEIIGAEMYKNKISMSGDKSSQYFSALLQIAPLLPQGLEIEVEGELVSKPYIDITLNEMKKFGVTVENNDYKSFIVKPQKYKTVDITVEGDASAASYFSALATIHGGKVTFNNIGFLTHQGDHEFVRICKELGSTIIERENSLTITGPTDGLLPRIAEIIDMESMPDVAPTLMAMAPFIPGVTKITGLSTLRIKECDRISAPVTELRKFGVEIVEGKDYVEINEWSNINQEKEIEVETYQDHRIAMSLAVFGSKVGKMKIINPKCVEKTYPLFWEDLNQVYNR
jgi:3-phosphoshikimate 1-carboxyvinyltransferase